MYLAQRRRIARMVTKARVQGTVTERKSPWAGSENSVLFSASLSTLSKTKPFKSDEKLPLFWATYSVVIALSRDLSKARALSISTDEQCMNCPRI